MHPKPDRPLGRSETPEAGPESPVAPIKRRIVPGLIIVAIVLIVTGVAAGLIPRLRQQSELAAETRQLSILPVTVVSPQPGKSSSDLPLPAEIKPWIDTPIHARSNGYLKRRFVDIGDYVEAGHLLAEIDTPELDQELGRARALQTQAEASLDLAKITSSRWSGLSKTRVVSDQENEEKQADLKLKEAAVESARAEVRRLENLKSFAHIIAPFAGTITTRNIDDGDLIVAGANKELFHLAQTRKLKVFVRVPQMAARSISPGQKAHVMLSELPGRTFTAEVVRTAGAIDADSRTLLVELNMANPKDEILAGSYAQVRFSDARKESVQTLPANAVLFRAEGPQVGVVMEDGKVELRTVKLGRDFGKTLEILAGLDWKDRVILHPPDSLISGAHVAIVEKKEKEKKR
jgi:RND family efflux transporter MFP subunit